MAPAKAGSAARERDVHGAGRPPGGRQFLLTHGQCGLHVLLQLVGAAAKGLLVLRRGARDAIHEGGHPAALARDPPVAQRLQRGAGQGAVQLLVEQGAGAVVAD